MEYEFPEKDTEPGVNNICHISWEYETVFLTRLFEEIFAKSVSLALKNRNYSSQSIREIKVERIEECLE